ncbi:MAG: hypothetical protein QXU48_02290 [Thermoplasmata archaeon]
MRVNWLAQIVCAVMLFSCIIPSVTRPAVGDGISIPTREIDVLFETRQLAYIELNPDRTQTIDMFVTMVSLDPGTEIKYFVPLKAKPTINDVKIVSDEEFEQLGINEAKSTVENYSNGKKEFDANVMKAALGFSISQLFTPLAASVFLINSAGTYAGSLSAPTVSYSTYGNGYSVSVLNFSSKESLKEFIYSLNLTIPQKLWHVINNYADYHFVYITLKTMPPVPEEDFNEFALRCPKTLAALKNFTKENPTLYFYSYESAYDFINHPYFVNVKNTFYGEAGESTKLYNTLNEIIAVLYGYGKEYAGLKINMKMPLVDGKIYYPLGTSTSWEGNQQIQVLIGMPSSFMLKDNPRGGSYLSLHGKNCYYFEFSGTGPDFDIDSEVTEGIHLQGTAYQISMVFYRTPISGVYLVLLLFVLPWYIPFIWIARNSRIKGKPRWMFYIVPLAIGLLSLIHFLVGVVLTIKFLRKFKQHGFVDEKIKPEISWVRSAMLATGIHASLTPFLFPIAPSMLGIISALMLTSSYSWLNFCAVILLGVGVIAYFLIFVVATKLVGEYARTWEGNVELIWIAPKMLCEHTEMSVEGKMDPAKLKAKLSEKLANSGYTIAQTYPKLGDAETLHFTGKDLEFAVLFKRTGKGNLSVEIFALRLKGDLFETWSSDTAQIDFIQQAIIMASEECKKE